MDIVLAINWTLVIAGVGIIEFMKSKTPVWFPTWLCLILVTLVMGILAFAVDQYRGKDWTTFLILGQLGLNWFVYFGVMVTFYKAVVKAIKVLIAKISGSSLPNADGVVPATAIDTAVKKIDEVIKPKAVPDDKN